MDIFALWLLPTVTLTREVPDDDVCELLQETSRARSSSPMSMRMLFFMVHLGGHGNSTVTHTTYRANYLLAATPSGPAPTGIAVSTVSEPVSMTETVLLPEFATYTRLAAE